MKKRANSSGSDESDEISWIRILIEGDFSQILEVHTCRTLSSPQWSIN